MLPSSLHMLVPAEVFLGFLSFYLVLDTSVSKPRYKYIFRLISEKLKFVLISSCLKGFLQIQSFSWYSLKAVCLTVTLLHFKYF